VTGNCFGCVGDNLSGCTTTQIRRFSSGTSWTCDFRCPTIQAGHGCNCCSCESSSRSCVRNGASSSSSALHGSSRSTATARRGSWTISLPNDKLIQGPIPVVIEQAGPCKATVALNHPSSKTRKNRASFMNFGKDLQLGWSARPATRTEAPRNLGQRNPKSQ